MKLLSKKKIKKSPEQFIINKLGKKTAVILPINKYEELMENLHELAMIAERKSDETVSFDAVKKKLKADGLI